LNYLIRRAADLDTVSSDGPPLALAMKSYSSENRANVRSSIQAVVETLLGDRKAVNAPGALNAALATGKLDLILTVLRAGSEFTFGQEIIFQGKNSTPSALLIDAYADGGKPSVAEKARIEKFVDAESPELGRPNPLGQNFAHLFAYYVPSTDYDALAHTFWLGGFQTFVRMSSQIDLLNQADELRMLPLHYWLISRNRWRALPGDADDLSTLMSHTDASMGLTINNDSALSLAVRTRRISLVKAILEQKPEMSQLIKIPNLQGKTPLDYARDSKDRKIYDLLQMSL
jgi:hypothetical protein